MNPVGVAAAARRATEWSLEHFWVAPSADGQGVGRLLFEHIVNAVRPRGGGTIKILSDPHAAGLYERMGSAADEAANRVRCLVPLLALPSLAYVVQRSSNEL